MVTPPPPPSSGDRSRPWLIVAIVVLAVALLAMGWFGIRPRLTNPSANQSSNPSATASTDESRAPIHMRWSAPLQLTDDNWLVPLPVVIDSGVDGIAIAGYQPAPDTVHAQAVDLESMRILWKSPDLFVFSEVVFYTPFGTAHGLVASAATTSDQSMPGVWVIDQRTGATLWQEPNSYVVAGGVNQTMMWTYTVDGGSTTMCARQIESPAACVWQKTVAADVLGDMWPGATFGGTSWVSLGKQVVDLATGEAAPFGNNQPGNESGFMYLGPSRDRIIKFSAADYQVWDTHKDAGVGAPIAKGGYDPYFDVVFDSESPVFVVLSESGETTAYDWLTGARQWQTTLGPPSAYGWATEIVGNTALFGRLSPNDVWAVDVVTGQITGHRTGLKLRGNATLGDVAYLSDGTTLHAVNPADLTDLGSIALPEADAYVAVVSGHVVAVAQSGRMYVLQT